MVRAGLLAVLLATMPAAASATWREARSEHFVIYSEDDARTLTDYAGKLEKFDRALRRLRKVEDQPVSPSNRVTIFVVQNTVAVRKLLGGDNDWAAGFYRPRAANSLIVTPSLRFAGAGQRGGIDPMIVLLHEYTHHFLFENLAAAYPKWYVEGFAEFASTAQFDADGAVGLGLPAQHRARAIFRPQYLSMADMLADNKRKLDDRETSTLYAMGWLLTHYLTFSDDRKGQLQRYFDAINDGKPRLEAAQAIFGDLRTLDRDVDAYARRKLDYWRVPPSQLPIGKIDVRELSPAAAAVLPLRMRLKRGVPSGQAAEFAKLVRTAAGPFPDDPDAQVLLANAEAMVGQRDAGDAAIARALAASPGFTDALVARAASVMRRRDEQGGTVDWPRVRAAIIQANRAEPDHPLPLMLFYDSFTIAGQTPSKSAVAGLEHALAVAPQDPALRMRLAKQLLSDRRIEEARLVLTPLAYAPHGGPPSDAARAMLDTLPAAAAPAG